MDLYEFASKLTEYAVKKSDDPISLRSGEMSHLYIDHRVGLSSGRMERAAGYYLLALAVKYGIEWDVVAATGAGGNGLAVAMSMLSGKYHALANLNENDINPKDGYGLHGASVNSARVLPVDDITSTGGSITELNTMVRSNGGMSEYALTVSDRSDGMATTALRAVGLTHYHLLDFDETAHRLVPSIYAAELPKELVLPV